VDWAAVAVELGYSDQAHLVRDFTAAVGTPPARYAREASRSSKTAATGRP
jgi:AraC-like DNA-binding protein